MIDILETLAAGAVFGVLVYRGLGALWHGDTRAIHLVTGTMAIIATVIWWNAHVVAHVH